MNFESFISDYTQLNSQAQVQVLQAFLNSVAQHNVKTKAKAESFKPTENNLLHNSSQLRISLFLKKDKVCIVIIIRKINFFFMIVENFFFFGKCLT